MYSDLAPSRLHHGAWTLTLGVTFAFGAFLPPPLKLASDQAKIGAQTLRVAGKKGHLLIRTSFGWKSTKLFSKSNLNPPGPGETSAAGILQWSHDLSHLPPLWQPVPSHLSTLGHPASASQHLQRFFVSTCSCSHIQTLSIHPSLSLLLLRWLHVCPIRSQGRGSRWSRGAGRKEGSSLEKRLVFHMIRNEYFVWIILIQIQLPSLVCQNTVNLK